MKNRCKTRKKNDYNSLDDKSNARGVNERKKTEQNRDRKKATFFKIEFSSKCNRKKLLVSGSI